MTSKKIYTLQFETKIGEYESNLAKLTTLIEDCEDDSIILAPEVCVSGFCYDDMEGAGEFAPTIINKLLHLSQNRIISTTIIEKSNTSFINTLYIFHNQKVVHKQSKYKLFALGNETKYFVAGDKEDIKIVQIDGIKIAALICFELRFVELWQQISGADIILVPAMWGKPRADHYATLSEALAIANQCFVVASDSANDDMAKNSAIITPFGKKELDNTKELISYLAKFSDITKMRRYLNTGI
jgi:predicted amidohydrolase